MQVYPGSNPRRFTAVPQLGYNRRAEFVFNATVTVMILQGKESNEDLMGANILTRGSNIIQKVPESVTKMHLITNRYHTIQQGKQNEIYLEKLALSPVCHCLQIGCYSKLFSGICEQISAYNTH